MTDNADTSAEKKIEFEVTKAIARLKSGVLAVIIGLIGGTGLFAMTAILLIESGPGTGTHLRLLGNYFWGYEVTWPGAIIGFFWGFATGATIGWLIGAVYNRIVTIRQG